MFRNFFNFAIALVLDLDETLIHCKNEDESGFMIQFRPGLIEFLKIMKKICELILFSFGTSSYVESVVKEIEKNEKFFEYVLDRNHGIFDNGNCIKDLNMFLLSRIKLQSKSVTKVAGKSVQSRRLSAIFQRK